MKRKGEGTSGIRVFEKDDIVIIKGKLNPLDGKIGIIIKPAAYEKSQWHVKIGGRTLRSEKSLLADRFRRSR